MPRANCYFSDLCSPRGSNSSIHGVVPNHVWYIRHSCPSLDSWHKHLKVQHPPLSQERIPAE